jgi:hypothetical protein
VREALLRNARRLIRKGTPIAGAILGRSLYVGAVKPYEALSAARA